MNAVSSENILSDDWYYIPSNFTRSPVLVNIMSHPFHATSWKRLHEFMGVLHHIWERWATDSTLGVPAIDSTNYSSPHHFSPFLCQSDEKYLTMQSFTSLDILRRKLDSGSNLHTEYLIALYTPRDTARISKKEVNFDREPLLKSFHNCLLPRFQLVHFRPLRSLIRFFWSFRKTASNYLGVTCWSLFGRLITNNILPIHNISSIVSLHRDIASQYWHVLGFRNNKIVRYL